MHRTMSPWAIRTRWINLRRISQMNRKIRQKFCSTKISHQQSTVSTCTDHHRPAVRMAKIWSKMRRTNKCNLFLIHNITHIRDNEQTTSKQKAGNFSSITDPSWLHFIASSQKNHFFCIRKSQFTHRLTANLILISFYWMFALIANKQPTLGLT